MIALPSIPKLIQRTKALATLDLIMSPDWDSRYYSFNQNWAWKEQMASMRNGSGDEWWIVFHQDGWAALKGLDHESKAWSKGREKLSKAIQSSLPPELEGFAQEPAFCWEATSFAYFHLAGSDRWQRANYLTDFASLDTGEDWLLTLTVAGPEAYVEFAESYYEKSVLLAIVESIYAHAPLTAEIVEALNPDITIDEISPELLKDIGYPLRDE